LEGGFTGAVAGSLSYFNPALAGMVGNLAGQLYELDRNDKGYKCVNIGSILGSGYGASINAFKTGNYLGGTLLNVQFDFMFSTTFSIAGGEIWK
jgi:hypothetical protein